MADSLANARVAPRVFLLDYSLVDDSGEPSAAVSVERSDASLASP